MQRRTLVATNVIDDLVVQVTDQSVRLFEANGQLLLDEWYPEGHVQITVAAVNPTQCVVSIGFGRLIALKIERGLLVVTG
jgi:DNA damage-binding protein 1